MTTVSVRSTAGGDKLLAVGTGDPPGDWAAFSADESAWVLSSSSPYSDGVDPLGSLGCQWVCPAAYGVMPYLPAVKWVLRCHFSLPPGVITAARFQVAPDDAIPSAFVNGVAVPLTCGDSYRAIIACDVPAAVLHQAGDAFGGANVLALLVQNSDAGTSSGPTRVQFAIDVTLSPDAVGTTGGASVATSGLYGAHLGAGTVRLKHGSGVVDWEHDGTLFRVRSGDQTVVQTPFPTMSGVPAVIMGRDPVTGLPMWSGQPTAPPPLPPPVSATYTQPDRSLEDTHGAPAPLPVPPSPQRVCGAAEAMADLAAVIYDAIVQIINKAKADILADFTQGLKRELTAELVSLLTEAEFAQWAIDAIQLALLILEQIVETLLNWGTNLPLIWPANTLGHPTSQQWLFMRCAAWQALWLTGGDYLARHASADGLGTKDYWQQALAPQWSFFAGSTQSGIDQLHPPWQLVWINAVIERVADVGWAFAAAKGAQAPSTGCAGCPGYPP